MKTTVAQNYKGNTVSIFGNFHYICMQVKKYFITLFLKGGLKFINSLDTQLQKKVLYNIQRAEYTIDEELFKKIRGNIWEFRTNYMKIQIRLLAFWYKQEDGETKVIVTHGFSKKTWQVPDKEIRRAENIRKQYFN